MAPGPPERRPLRDGHVALAAGLVLALLCAGILPVWWLSLHTPLRLVDDYGASFELWDRPLRDHLAANLLPSEEESRFRPTYELGQMVAFGLFGADYRGHHALRLLLKVLAFAALLGVAFRRLEGAAGAALPAPLRWVTAAFAFALFFYFPNNPEARLTPQELPTVACFLGCLFFLDRREEKDRPLRDDLLALGCFALGLWSKEPNVIPGAVLLYAALAATARGRTRAVSSLRIAYVVLWAHAVMKDAVIMALGGYGRPHLGPAEVAAMAREIPRQVLLGATAPWLPGLFAIGLAAFVWLGARRAATRPARRQSILLLALALAFVAQYLLLPGAVLRYAYPAAVMVVLLTVIGFGLLLAASPSERGRRRRELALAALALAFALACYRDMTAQFATQYVAGWTETAMLERVERLQAAIPAPASSW